MQLIRCYLKGKPRAWDKDLQLLASAIRAMPNWQTGLLANNTGGGGVTSLGSILPIFAAGLARSAWICCRHMAAIPRRSSSPLTSCSSS